MAVFDDSTPLTPLQDLLTQVLGDSGDISPTLGSGWSNIAYATVYNRRNGSVNIAVWATKSTWAAGDVLFTLPPGFRPSITWPLTCLWGNEMRAFRVQPDGKVLAHAAGGAGACGAITFPVAT
jgi:hypothetical protein